AAKLGPEVSVRPHRPTLSPADTSDFRPAILGGVSTGVDAAGSVEQSQVVGTRVERFARNRRRWYARPVLVILAVTALAGGLRFYHLSSPSSYVFDETYYAKDGCLDAGFPFQACHLETANEQTFTVHPPLGRWIVA